MILGSRRERFSVGRKRQSGNDPAVPLANGFRLVRRKIPEPHIPSGPRGERAAIRRDCKRTRWAGLGVESGDLSPIRRVPELDLAGDSCRNQQLPVGRECHRRDRAGMANQRQPFRRGGEGPRA